MAWQRDLLQFLSVDLLCDRAVSGRVFVVPAWADSTLLMWGRFLGSQ
jgi:hypothetical protein